jgi:hypothetical protein
LLLPEIGLQDQKKPQDVKPDDYVLPSIAEEGEEEGEHTPVAFAQPSTIMAKNPRDFLSEKLIFDLQNETVKYVAPNIASIVVATSSETVASVFKKLIDFRILSVPVLDVTTVRPEKPSPTMSADSNSIFQSFRINTWRSSTC